MGFEGGHPNSLTVQQPAKAGDDDALAHIRPRSQYRDRPGSPVSSAFDPVHSSRYPRAKPVELKAAIRDLLAFMILLKMDGRSTDIVSFRRRIEADPASEWEAPDPAEIFVLTVKNVVHAEKCLHAFLAIV